VKTVKMTAKVNANVRKTRDELKGRKLIKCPVCRELLMDLDKNDKVELFKLPTRKPHRWKEVKVCAVCKSKIGFNLITAAEPLGENPA
jgi:hypothetical protein